MKRFIALILIIQVIFLTGCDDKSSDAKDQELVNKQQGQYGKVHPLPFFDHSIPRDVYTQIYEVVTTKAYTTYTIIESITGMTKFHGVSIGYGIPVDTSLTNPLQKYSGRHLADAVIEQAEPNGLFSSKNTDGTWVLFVQSDGSVTPIYTEHKVTTFPFPVVPDGSGGWCRPDNTPS